MEPDDPNEPACELPYECDGSCCGMLCGFRYGICCGMFCDGEYGRGDGVNVEPSERPLFTAPYCCGERVGMLFVELSEACAADPIDGARAPNAAAEAGVA